MKIVVPESIEFILEYALARCCEGKITLFDGF